MKLKLNLIPTKMMQKHNLYKHEHDGWICVHIDIDHGYYGPETGDQVQESNPGPTKRSCCKARESNPGPTKKIACKARGSNPGPTKKIVRTILHAIAKYNRTHDLKNSCAYEIRADARTSSMWNMSAG